MVSLLNTQMRNSFNILQIGTQNIYQGLVSFARIKVRLEAFMVYKVADMFSGYQLHCG
jgi:dihydroorotate dehydrogenase